MATNSVLIKCISHLYTILKVQPGKLSFNADMLPVRTIYRENTVGFLNIIYEVLHECTVPYLLGRSNEDHAEVRQWLEYVLLYVANAENGNAVNNVLRELNAVLLTKTYLVSNKVTLADLVLYCALQSIMAKLSYLEKEKYINVSRWFDNIQYLDKVKAASKPIDFKTVYLVAAAPSRH